jgi:hypothetical protein
LNGFNDKEPLYFFVYTFEEDCIVYDNLHLRQTMMADFQFFGFSAVLL